MVHQKAGKDAEMQARQAKDLKQQTEFLKIQKYCESRDISRQKKRIRQTAEESIEIARAYQKERKEYDDMNKDYLAFLTKSSKTISDALSGVFR